MSQPTAHVIKRNRTTIEEYSPDKIFRSLRAACLSVRTPDGHADDTAKKVGAQVSAWCAGKPEVTSADIRRQAARILEQFHPEAAYMYQHHRVMM